MGDDQRFWRVYRQEWAVVYISDTDGQAGMEECQKFFGELYAGKVRETEWRVGPWSMSEPELWPWGLELLLPVLKGEFTDRPRALVYARVIDGVVALEGSVSDKHLLNYGKRMLYGNGKRGSVGRQGMGSEGAPRGAEGQAR